MLEVLDVAGRERRPRGARNRGDLSVELRDGSAASLSIVLLGVKPRAASRAKNSAILE
jgi:hypothetical protein